MIVFDNLGQNFCDVMRDHFKRNTLGKNRRNKEKPVRLQLVKIKCGKKGFYIFAAKEFSDLPLQSSKISSHLPLVNF